MPLHSRVFQLMNIYPNMHGRAKETVAVVVLPEMTALEVVVAAWSYAVCYSADGINLPNYPNALQLLQERHPRWQIIACPVLIANYDQHFVDHDLQE